MKPRLTFTTLVDPITGYGQQAVAIARGLAQVAHVSVRPIRTWEAWGMKIPADVRAMFVSGLQPEEWELMLHPPDFAPTPGKRTVFFTMWESTRLQPMGVEFLNRAEAVVTPSQWNASCFSAAGVDRPIYVVPLGIDTSLYRWRPEPESIKDLCVFGAAGRMAHGGRRKGLEEVVELFLEAFPHEKEVRLKLKCFPDCPIKKPLDKRVEIIQACYSEEQLAQWFEHLHCFVSAARSEGWGLMQQEALATGRPIISVNFGGVREFFQPEMGYAVGHRLRPAQFHYEGCGHWAEPDGAGMMGAMRTVYENKALAMQRGAAGARAVSWFSHGRTIRELLKVLAEVGMLASLNEAKEGKA